MFKLKKLTACVLLLAMLTALLAACSSGGSPQQPKAEEDTGNAGAVQTQNTLSGMVYVPEYITVSADIQDMQNISYYDGALYFRTGSGSGAAMRGAGARVTGARLVGGTSSAASAPGGSDDEDDGYTVYKLDVDTKTVLPLANFVPLTIPEGREGTASLSAMCVDAEGNLVLVEQINYYRLENDAAVSEGTEFWLRKIDRDGAELSKTNISAFAEGYSFPGISAVQTDKDGNTVIAAGEAGINVFDKDGQLLFKIANANWVNSLVRTDEGAVGAVIFDMGGGSNFKTVDMVSKDWSTDGVPVSMMSMTAYPGANGFTFFYNESNDLMGYNPETGESENLLNWVNCDLNPNNLRSVTVLPDNSVLCTMYSAADLGGKIELAVLSQKDASEVKQKTTLTLAVLDTDYSLTAAVVDFNRKSSDSRIEILDYSSYNTSDDYSLGLLKFTNDITTGNIPDLMAVNMIPVNRYIAKGLIENLYPFIDADAELSRDDLVTEYFKALEVDGGLYQISPSFTISTVVGNAGAVGSEIGWSLDELLEVHKTMPPENVIFPNMYNSTILYYLCAMDMVSFVDWSTGACSFDSQDFINILEFAAMFPEVPSTSGGGGMAIMAAYESDADVIADGRAFLSSQTMSDFRSIQTYKAMFGGEVSFKGFPVESGNGNAFSSGSGVPLAMSTQCADKDAAWQFMRVFLTEDYQNSNSTWSFPSNRHTFERVLAESMKKETRIDENGEEVEVPVSSGRFMWGMGLNVEYFATTPEERDQIMELISSTEKYLNYDSSIMEIITEEAAPFFAGQKTAAETAAVIQGRCNIYVNEQR